MAAFANLSKQLPDLEDATRPSSFPGKLTDTTRNMGFFTTDTRTALEAKSLAQWIAFGPVVFQVSRVLRDSGILQSIEEGGADGLTLEEILGLVSMSAYGVRVLLESGLGIGLVTRREGRYRITKTGSFILNDPLTRTNMDFIQDVNYKGLFCLDKSIENGKPEGLKEFGDWDTIYEGISDLPARVQKSWFGFDHFFSDTAFPAAIRHVYRNGIQSLLDIGGNTGKWAILSLNHDPGLHITIMDLPGPLKEAKKKIEEAGLSGSVSFHPTNILNREESFPGGFDAIWMSQFLDCFSEEDIISILERCRNSLKEGGMVLILEAFWDRQRFETAAFCLQQTSIYFTALANGKSQMYDSAVFKECIRKARFEIVEEVDNIGLSHTLLKCRKIS